MAEGLTASSWVPRTKLLRPRPAPDAVVNQALVAFLRRAVASVPLTLVSAQAGAGKTTLAAALADASPGLPVAWLSLDERDDSLPDLLGLLAAAIEDVLPGVADAFADLLRTGLPAAANPRRAMGVLVNDLLAAAPPPFLLVLDDLHALRDPTILQALDHLVALAPPALHLVATTRVDPPLPLARLRARGQLAEVRGEDLRFTLDQTQTLLNERLGLGLSPDEVQRAATMAGGWVTGVRLLGHSLEQGTAGWSRAALVGAAEPDALFDYLAEEIWARESEATRAFLRDTCVLDDLTPTACEALAGRSDAAALLADLHRRHHFLVVLASAAPVVYRYHDLFTAFLRRHLAAECSARVAERHRRAADAVADPARRVEHLLAAGDGAAAAALVEQLGRAAFPRPGELRQVAAWIARLPESTRVERPWLAVLAGLVAVQRGDFGEAARGLAPLLAPLEAAGDYLGQWIAARSLHLATNDHAHYVPILARLEASPAFADLPPAARVDHHLSSAYGALFTGRRDEVARRLAAALDLTAASGDTAALETVAQHLSPLLMPDAGMLDRVEAYTAWTQRRFPDPPPLIRLGLQHQLAISHLLRGRLDQALLAVEQAGDLPERLGGLPYLRATLDWVEAGVRLARGDLEAARRSLARRLDTPPPSDLDQSLSNLALAAQARTLRLLRRTDDLAALAAAASGMASERFYADFGALVRLVVQAQARWAAGDTAGAADLLAEAAALEARLRLVPFVPSPRLDLALLLAESGQPERALAELAPLLANAERWGMAGLLAQSGPSIAPLLRRARDQGVSPSFATAVLAVLGAAPARTPLGGPAAPEALSPREAEVLRLLAAGASNRAIADTLVISPNTVKTHVGRVLDKLGARSRAEAAARARALGLA